MIGQTLSHFKITAKLGEGGMGEVYRAEDTKLGREVAIKVLPEAFTADPERLARFEREAHLLASLNHPHIAAIYEIGQQDRGSGAPALRFLAMELAAGEDLSIRLERGAIAIDETLTIALQIAQALEAAHERDVVHRDLKPANVMVSEEGQVKVLDFGLAKAGAEEESRPDLSLSPTLTAQMTQAGTILGTAAYMSPEQAKGKSVDKRADVWAFGVLLWEMLTGKRLFTGESASEVLASVLMSQPDMEALPARTPARIRRLVERCLRQDPGSRLRDMGDARIVLEEALAGHEWTHESTPEARSTRPRLVTVVTLIGIGLALGMGMVRIWGGDAGRDRPPLTELAIPLPSSLRITSGKPLLSPDGRTAIFSAADIDPTRADHHPRLYLRPLDSSRLVEVEDSQGVAGYVLSPDGRWLAFVARTPGTQNRRRLLKIPLDLSAPALELTDFPDNLTPDHLLWPTMETLLTSRIGNEAIVPIPAQGGSPGSPVPTSARVFLSAALPGGQYILATWPNFASGAYRQDSVAVDWHTGEVRTLVEDSSWPVLAPTGRHLIFAREDKLLAIVFDPARLETSGATVSLREGLWAQGAYTGGEFGISATGDLLYPGGGVQGGSRYLALVTEDGAAQPWSPDRLFFGQIAISPDGAWLATQVDNVTAGDALLQIRASPFDQPRLTNIGTFPGKDCDFPVWSPASNRLAFRCIDADSSTLHVVPIDRSQPAAAVLEGSQAADFIPLGFSPAANRLIATQRSSEGTTELISIALDGSDTEPIAIRVEETRLLTPQLSPDGRWLAYVADEAGRRELYVRRFEEETSLGPRFLAVSNVDWLFWSKSNRGEGYRIFFVRNSKLWAVHMTAAAVPGFSVPTELGVNLFDLGIRGIDSLPDGRFLAIRAPDTEIGAAELRLVLNWTRELESRFASSH